MRMRRYYHDESYSDALDTLIRRILHYFDLIAFGLLVLKLCGVITIGYGIIALLYIMPCVFEFVMDVICIRIEKTRKKKEEEEMKKRAEKYAAELHNEFGYPEDE